MMEEDVCMYVHVLYEHVGKEIGEKWYMGI